MGKTIPLEPFKGPRPEYRSTPIDPRPIPLEIPGQARPLAALRFPQAQNAVEEWPQPVQQYPQKEWKPFVGAPVGTKATIWSGTTCVSFSMFNQLKNGDA